jgi:molybdopterin molybdotransferase
MPTAKRGSGSSAAAPRMRPFKALLSKDAALSILLDAVAPLRETETLPLSEAHGRALAKDVKAPLDVPAFTRSAMDGYAVRAEDTFGASRTEPKKLKVVGSIHAGDAAKHVVTARTAVQIATGGKLPEGANAVVKVESTTAKGDEVLVAEAIPPGANVSRQGSDVRRGSPVVRNGDLLHPARVGLLASLGIGTVEVYRRPRVAVIPTGNEVQELGRDLAEGQVYNSNSYGVAALLAEHGAAVKRFPVVPDDVERIRAAILEGAKDCDLVVLSGGSSVGERDLLVDVVQKHGTLLVHGVQVKPG